MKRFRNSLERVLGGLESKLPSSVVDFDVCQEILPFPLPIEEEDFSLPEIWRKQDTYPSFRMLKQNMYRHPLQRTVCAPSDVPTCSCVPATGCDENCTNRMLFMYVDL